MPDEIRQLGAVRRIHSRTLTYRVIAILLLAFLLPLCWVVWVNGYQGIASVTAVLLAGISTWFFVAQSRERLLVCERGLELERNGVVWSMPWSEIDGIFAIIHQNDLAKVTLRSSTSLQVTFDLNWRERRALESLVHELLETYPGLPQPIYSPFGLGDRLGRWLGRMVRGGRAAPNCCVSGRSSYPGD